MKKFKLGLVVDDNEMDTFVVKALIEKLSFAETVWCASSAQKALELIQTIHSRIKAGEWKAAEICIFLDYEMPYLNGGGFAVALEKMLPELLQQTYMLSILSIDEQVLRMDMKPALRGFLSKPLTEGSLHQILRQGGILPEVKKAG